MNEQVILHALDTLLRIGASSLPDNDPLKLEAIKCITEIQGEETRLERAVSSKTRTPAGVEYDNRRHTLRSR